jgi:hypothetical protein
MALAGRNRKNGRLAEENITRAFPKLIARLEVAARSAGRCFLVALFIIGFTSSYSANPGFKPHPQNSVMPRWKTIPKPRAQKRGYAFETRISQTLCSKRMLSTDLQRSQRCAVDPTGNRYSSH